jgi:hypothetical protein
VVGYVAPPSEVCCIQMMTKIHCQQRHVIGTRFLTDLPLVAGMEVKKRLNIMAQDIRTIVGWVD